MTQLAESQKAEGRSQILVVEDELVVSLDIENSLRALGYVPITAYTGDDAVQKAAANPVDLVLMDIKLKGGIDGIDAAREIRRERDVPIIYLTAYADAKTLARARQTQPYGYILKPFQIRELQATIDMTLERRRRELVGVSEEKLQAFLVRAITRMVSTLDAHQAAEYALALLVPDYADWCAVEIAALPGALAEPIVIAAGQSPNPNLMAKIRGALQTVRRNNDSQLVTHVVEQRSFSCIALEARGRCIGALAVTRPVRPTPNEIAFFESFARGLSIAVDNALRFAQHGASFAAPSAQRHT